MWFYGHDYKDKENDVDDDVCSKGGSLVSLERVALSSPTQIMQRFSLMQKSVGQICDASSMNLQSMRLKQGPTGRGFQLRDGLGSGIGKHISGRIGYGSGTGIFIIYLSIGYYRVVQILIGYFLGISLRHIYLMVPDGFQWAPIVCMVADGR